MNLKAFTLLEILLVSAMIIIFGMVVGPILGNAVQSTTITSSRRQVLAETRAGMDRMVKEISLIPTTNVLGNIGASSFQFQYPLGTSITYSLSGTNLLRNSDILIGHVTSLTFTYYGESGSTTETAANVRSIGIDVLTLSIDDNSPLRLRTQVFLRNTGYNYGNLSTP